MKKIATIAIVLSAATGMTQTRTLVTDPSGRFLGHTNFFFSNFVAGANVTLTATKSNITIAATGGGGGGGGALLLETGDSLLLE